MPYFSRLATLLALAALATVGILLFAGSRGASAAPVQALQPLPAATSPVESVGYSKRYRRAYVAGDYVGDAAPSYRSTSQANSRRGVNYEIKELQRLFPETNWPPSMRVRHY